MRKFKVTVANNEIMHLERNWLDYWMYDNKLFKSFRKQDGGRIRLAVHWILKIEEVKDWAAVIEEERILALASEEEK